jgi:hypothetical protein
MKTLIAAVAFAAVIAAPAFAQSTYGSPNRVSATPGPISASPSHTRGGSRMRESRSYGSVAWTWKGASAAPATARSAYAFAPANARSRGVASVPIYAGTYKRPNVSPASPSFGGNGY